MGYPGTSITRDNNEVLSRIERSILNRPDRITIANLWTVYARRSRCEMCEGRIGHLDLDFEMDAELPKGREILHFHALCYDRWLALAGSMELSERLASLIRMRVIRDRREARSGLQPHGVV